MNKCRRKGEGTPKNYRIPVQKAEIKVSDDYEVFPEKISNKGRGITIQTHKSHEAQEVNFSTMFEESIRCEVNLTGPDKLLSGCIYRSESGTEENNCKLQKLVLEANTKGYSHVLIMGDFNYKGIIWENWSTSGLSETSKEFLFIEALRDSYLYQHITQQTRIRQGQEPSILDLIITNEEGVVEGMKYLNPLEKSNHIILCFDFRCYI